MTVKELISRLQSHDADEEVYLHLVEVSKGTNVGRCFRSTDVSYFSDDDARTPLLTIRAES